MRRRGFTLMAPSGPCKFEVSMRHPVLCSLLLAATLPTGFGQAPAAPGGTVPVLMLSDLHFDPFRGITDARLKQLMQDAPDQWSKTLDKPITAAEQAEVDAAARKQAFCDSGKTDTDYTLLANSIAEERKDLASPLFITVSGDLTTHHFDCKYKALVKDWTEDGLRDFAAKTAAFVAWKLNAAFPKSPIYLALGNNDSGCTDYVENEGSATVPDPYFNAIAKQFAEVALDNNNAKSILASFPARGDYSVLLPKPFKDTKLIVLQDLFESANYNGDCSGGYPTDAIAAQIAWLKAQLADTGVKHFWVMAHIPPGVDPYSTIRKPHACSGDPTLLGTGLANTLRESTSDIELALYGHTHMDEMRLIVDGSGNAKVPGRLNPSITPWDGNLPSFTVAQVDPGRALLVDFTVFRAPDKVGTPGWDFKYTYSDAYQQKDYSAASLKTLATLFKKDTSSDGPVSKYQTYYQSSTAAKNWKAYVCAVVSGTPDQYNTCNACPKTTKLH
jgi:sphingomyelin phosphodiesterase acid-like 3